MTTRPIGIRKPKKKSDFIPSLHHPDESLTEEHVSQEFKVPRATLKFWRWARVNNKTAIHGPEFFKVGRSVRYKRTAVEAFFFGNINPKGGVDNG